MSGSMYRVGVNPIKRRHRHLVVYVFVLLIIIVVGLWLKHSLRTNTTIATPPPPITKTVADNNKPVQQFDEGLFSLNLPAGWVFDGHQTQSVNTYTWHSTDTKAAGRQLLIYVDSPESTMGVNRAIMVRANAGKLTVDNQVSDNCASFTTTAPGASTIATPAKWQGLDFLCDMGNYERDVVGAVSPDGINKVVLTGAANGQHSFFFTYTDNNIQPDFSPFLAALQSFQLK